jgi:hypothetical protein
MGAEASLRAVEVVSKDAIGSGYGALRAPNWGSAPDPPLDTTGEFGARLEIKSAAGMPWRIHATAVAFAAPDNVRPCGLP